MKVMGVARYGGPLAEFEQPAPAPPGTGQVQVRMLAVSVNPVDRGIAQGYGAPVLNRHKRFPYLLGRDGCGVVAALGAGVTDLRVGQRVAIAVSPRTAATYADLVNFPRACLAPVADSLSDELVAGVAYAGLTAMQALAAAGVTELTARGLRICINGATGGFGAVATQLAAHWGAEVIAVCSQANHAWARQLGASQVVDYRDAQAMAAVRAHVVINGAPPTTLADMMLDPLSQALITDNGRAAYATVVTPAIGLVTTKGLVAGLILSAANYIQRRWAFGLRGARYRWVIFREDPGALSQLMRFFELPVARTVVKGTRPREALPQAFYDPATLGAGKLVFRWQAPTAKTAPAAVTMPAAASN
jgi:NADPH:quinone reductase-like Zn-dependent oxidoreductase